ncbi:MAG TPA: zinc-binding dehydrogenase [Acidimicrobiales bacterium]|nr:zinc-binding dehydrogenase [Acidimicrobiales bacterium]
MKAATIVDGAIVVREHPDPEPGESQILVRVHAAGLNAADSMQRHGYYPPPPGVPVDIPGLEFAGDVVATGRGVRRWSVGDRVMSVVGGGGQAELIVVHERQAVAVPAVLAWEEAGALPEVFTTAHDALFTQAGLTIGEKLCVHGAAGGVGTAAVQLAVAAGARVVASVRKPDLRERVAALGATAVDPSEAPAYGPYDVILELVGAPNMGANVESLSTGGRIAVIGVGGGSNAELNLLGLMAKRGRIHGSTLRPRPLEAKAHAARRLEAQVLPLFDSGSLHVPIEATFALEEAAAAYDRFDAGGKFGKVVITMA